MKNTIRTILEAKPAEMTADFFRDLSKDVMEIAQSERMTINEVAVLSAASGIMLGAVKELAEKVAKVEAKRKALKNQIPAENLTSLDL